MEKLKESIRENLDGQFSEFDHRYQMLASEISNLKQIVLKLQSYTLEINQSLFEERTEILSKLENVQQRVDSAIVNDASTNTREDEENISFSISNVKEEFFENNNEEPNKTPFDFILDRDYTEEELKQLTPFYRDLWLNKKKETEEQVQEPVAEETEEQVQETVAEETEEQVQETVAEETDEKCCDAGECCETKECCDNNDCCTQKTEDQVQEPVAEETEEQLQETVSGKNEKSKRKRKQKNVVAVAV